MYCCRLAYSINVCIHTQKAGQITDLNVIKSGLQVTNEKYERTKYIGTFRTSYIIPVSDIGDDRVIFQGLKK